MRTLSIALICALLGGLAALGIGKAAGWVGSGSTTTVFRSSPIPLGGGAAPASVGPSAKPLAGNGFNPRKIYASRSPGVVTIYSQYGSGSSAQIAQGSGFVVSRDGYILTNSHVVTNAGDSTSVHGADHVYVEFQDLDRVPAKIVGWDIFDDVALIKVDPKDHPVSPVPLGDSAAVSVGEPVAAIGSPFGQEDSLGVGVVSATHRSIASLTSKYSLVDAIQTDAPINHGNSGGPLFDARGRVIGINAQIRSDSGTAEGVGFAVPIDSARRSMQQLIADGKVSYAYVGIVTTNLTPAYAKHFHYGANQGAAVTSIVKGSPADKAHIHAPSGSGTYLGVGFPVGADVITAIDGIPVRNSEDVVRVVTERVSPGETAAFTIVRGNQRLQVPVRLSQRKTNP
jgi:S1-C subfamily serine protease